MSWLLRLIPGTGAISSFFSGAWGFLSSTAGVVVVCLLAGYVAGYKVANNKTELSTLRGQIERLQRDITIAKEQEELAVRQSKELAISKQQIEEKLNAIDKTIKQRAAARNSCLLDDSDVRRLRSIR